MTVALERVEVLPGHPYAGMVGLVLRRSGGLILVELDRGNLGGRWQWFRPEHLKPWGERAGPIGL